MDRYQDRPIGVLVGQTLLSVERRDVYNEDALVLKTKERSYIMYHCSDCCENVRIEDVCGDFADLIGEPIVLAEVVTSEERMDGQEPCDSFTWTFYKLGTTKGVVTIRWLGESNGCYSESVDFCEEVNDE